MTDQEHNMGNWITTREAGRILGVSARRVRQLVKSGDIRRVRYITTQLMLVNRDDVEEYDRTRG